MIRTTVNEYQILWLGDASVKAAEILLQNKDQLKCDIVQVAHHGNDCHDTLCALYQATDASIALWPTADYNLHRKMWHDVSRLLLYGMGIREHIVSWFGTAALPLPYAPGMANKNHKVMSLEKQPDPGFRFCNAEVPSSVFRYLTPEPVMPDCNAARKPAACTCR